MGLSYFTCVFLVTRPFTWYCNIWPHDLDLEVWPTFEKLKLGCYLVMVAARRASLSSDNSYFMTSTYVQMKPKAGNSCNMGTFSWLCLFSLPGSGRVTFSSKKSYMKAVQAAFIEIKTPKFTKKVSELSKVFILQCWKFTIVDMNTFWGGFDIFADFKFYDTLVTDYNSVRETLWSFIGHSVLLGESFHRTELISVWLWVYIVYIVLEAALDISVRLEMRQIGPITYLSCQSDGQMNLADTVTSNWSIFW